MTEQRVNKFFRDDDINVRSFHSNSIDNIYKVVSKNSYPSSFWTPSPARRNKSDNYSPSDLFEEEKRKKSFEYHENFYSDVSENKNITESENESHEEDVYYLSGRKRRRESSNQIPNIHIIKLNQVNVNEKNDIGKINNKENKANIKLDYKNENNNQNYLFKNEINFDSPPYINQEDYIMSDNENFSEHLLTLDKSINLEEESEETKKSETLTNVLKENKDKKKVEKAQKPVCIKKDQRIKYENVNPNNISQESDKDINMNSNTKLYANKGEKISSKINPGNLGIILDNEIISNQKNNKEKENSSNSKKKKPNTKEIIFNITTEKQKLVINNSIDSKTKTKEKQNKQLLNLNNININTGQMLSCQEIKENGVDGVATEKQEEENIIINEQPSLELKTKENREDNNIIKIIKNALSNFYEKINKKLEEKKEKLKFQKFTPKIAGNIKNKENMKLYEKKMKHVISITPEKNKENNEKIEKKNKNMEIIDKLEKEYNKESDIRELLEMKFSDYIKRFFGDEKDKEDWKEFIKESRKEQENFYIQKKYKKFIDYLKEKRENEKNKNNKEKYNKYLGDLEKYARFTGKNKNGKIKLKNNPFCEKELEKNRFEYYNYEINKEEDFKSYIKRINEFENLKFDYDKDVEINTYIESLNKLKENFLEVFEGRESNAAPKKTKI